MKCRTSVPVRSARYKQAPTTHSSAHLIFLSCFTFLFRFYRMHHLSGNPQQSRIMKQPWHQKRKHPSVTDSRNIWRNTRTKVTLAARPLLMPPSQMRARYSWAQRVFIIANYSATKAFATVRKAFSNPHLHKELRNKTTIYRLLTEFHGTGSVWRRSRGYGRTASSSANSCNGPRLQEFSTAAGFVVSCVKRFTCSSTRCLLNGKT
jgi:hypothetical protein